LPVIARKVGLVLARHHFEKQLRKAAPPFVILQGNEMSIAAWHRTADGRPAKAKQNIASHQHSGELA
jgi:hypothetical protein